MENYINKGMNLLLKYYEKSTKNDFFTSLIPHCILVMDFGKMIIAKLDGFSEELKKKGELACLLHDIGKFKLKDFSNLIHGDIGYKILLENNIEEDIALSVKYHDKYSYDGLFEENYYLKSNSFEKKNIEFLVKINKDAGELANILDLFFSNKFKNLNNNSKISENVKKSFLDKKLVNNKIIKTELDYVFMRLSGIFDLNFSETKEILIGYNLIALLKDYFRKYIDDLDEILEMLEILRNEL